MLYNRVVLRIRFNINYSYRVIASGCCLCLCVFHISQSLVAVLVGPVVCERNENGHSPGETQKCPWTFQIGLT